MTIGRTVRRLAAATSFFLLLPASMGCGPSTPDAKLANVQSADMPSGADWTGVYFSELYGYLHVVQDGNKVTGKWMTPVKDKWGELQGEAVGDLLKFEWKEHTIGAVGPNSQRDGRGYFKYKRPPGDNVDDTIAGERGRQKDEVGEPWDGVKQRNMKPDLASIGGTGAGDIGGGDWDGENKETTSPEPPAPPP